MRNRQRDIQTDRVCEKEIEKESGGGRKKERERGDKGGGVERDGHEWRDKERGGEEKTVGREIGEVRQTDRQRQKLEEKK